MYLSLIRRKIKHIINYRTVYRTFSPTIRQKCNQNAISDKAKNIYIKNIYFFISRNDNMKKAGKMTP